MGDNQGRTIVGESLQRRLNICFTFNIKGARRFVENQNGRVAEKSASDCDALTLPTRKVDPSLTEECVITAG